MKIDICIKFFLNSIAKEGNLSEKTIKAYNSDLKHFYKILSEKDIENITTDEIRKYIDFIAENVSYKDSTIKRKIATLRVFFTYLEAEGIVKNTPMNKIKRKYKIAKRLPKVMSIRELKRLLKTTYNEVKDLKTDKKNDNSQYFLNGKQIRSYRNRAILEILIYTGIRIGELVVLNLSDIKLIERTILIFGKGRKERIIYISNDEVLSAIKEYIVTRKTIKTDTKALFLNKYNERLSIYSIENIFTKYCKKARIKKHYTAHCLRHTMATMMLNNGADIRSIQEILGHASIITTQIYTEVSLRHKKKVMTKFNHRNKIFI